MNGARKLEEMLVGLMSLFFATAVSYWCSDYWIDYKIAVSTFPKVFLSIVGFVLIPFIFWLLDKNLTQLVSRDESNLKTTIIIVGIFVCFTLAKSITGII